MPRYTIEAEASILRVEVRTTLHPLVATGGDLQGFLDVGLADGALRTPARTPGRLEVVVDRLRTGNALIDRETARRVDVRRHPRIVADLEQIEAGARAGEYRLRGHVAFHGVTRPAEGVAVAKVVDDGGRLRLTGTQEFDVREFALEPPRLLVLRLHPEVRVSVDLSARRAARDATTDRPRDGG